LSHSWWASVLVLHQRQEPGGNNRLHFHDHEEVMVQLEGTSTVVLGDETTQLMTGDAIIVPARVLHQVRNEGGASAQWLVALPAGSRFFRPDGEEVHAAFLN
jgi:mannose-6-phosphate isomerase-like protein (cupin superfamily)